MKTIRAIALGTASAALLLATGCASTSTQIYDPSEHQTNLRSSHTISHEELRLVVKEAVRDALTRPKFNRYVERFRAEHNGRNPVLKLDATVNETNDPDLNTAVISDTLFEELLNSDKVEVTMAEGRARSDAIGNSRLNAYDPNFNQSTVAKQGTLVAANLTMRPKVVSNEVRDGRTKAVERFFVMDMAEIENGMIMWKFSKPLGFTKTRGVVGW